MPGGWPGARRTSAQPPRTTRRRRQCRPRSRSRPDAMGDDIRKQAIALYDRFTHEGMDRRLFMTRMVALAGSVAAAEALIGAIAASPAAAAIVRPDDRRLTTRTQALVGG